MAQVVDANSEGGFVLASLMEFMKAWESGANARLFLESTNGSAFVSFGCFLGQPTDMHFKPKKKEKSKKKQERDNLRAANFQAAMNQNGGESAKSDESIVDDVVVDQDDGETAGGNPPVTDKEDVDDFQEFIIKCQVDLKVDGLNCQSWGPEFETRTMAALTNGKRQPRRDPGGPKGFAAFGKVLAKSDPGKFFWVNWHIQKVIGYHGNLFPIRKSNETSLGDSLGLTKT